MVTKEQAGYEVPAKNPNTPCGGCRHFLGGNCSIVSGLIETYSWCRFWEAA
jgi:cytidine deaminase